MANLQSILKSYNRTLSPENQNEDNQQAHEKRSCYRNGECEAEKKIKSLLKNCQVDEYAKIKSLLDEETALKINPEDTANTLLSPTHCPNCTCEHILPINPMVEEHRKVITAMWKLYDVWDEDLSFNYPKYLPSFDDFIHDFRWLLGYDADKERGGAEVE